MEEVTVDVTSVGSTLSITNESGGCGEPDGPVWVA